MGCIGTAHLLALIDALATHDILSTWRRHSRKWQSLFRTANALRRELTVCDDDPRIRFICDHFDSAANWKCRPRRGVAEIPPLARLQTRSLATAT